MTAAEAIERLKHGPGNAPLYVRDALGSRYPIDRIEWEWLGPIYTVYRTSGSSSGAFTIPFA